MQKSMGTRWGHAHQLVPQTSHSPLIGRRGHVLEIIDAVSPTYLQGTAYGCVVIPRGDAGVSP